MNYLFITGAGRSGTSFLMKVMTRSPEVHMATEIHFFSALFHDGLLKNLRKANFGACGESAWSPGKLARFLNSGRHFGIFWKKTEKVTPEEIKNIFGAVPSIPREIYRFLLHRDWTNKAPGKSARYIGEKTPLNIFHAARLFRWFPNARILYIYRNPIDVLRSEVNKDDKPDYPVKRTSPAYAWGLIGFVFLEWLAAGLVALYQRKRRPEQFLVISYEGFASRPVEIMEQVAGRLGIGFSKEMVAVKRFASSFAGKDRSTVWRPPAWVERAYNLLLAPVRRRLDNVRVRK